MKTSRLNGVLHHLRAGLESCGPSDGRLLEHFLTHRDEKAFDTLVRRHGPMVLGVCKRVLRNSHDAEDAFQATFLVLVRKAASIHPRELVGHWLYGVAYRTASKAKALAARRGVKERSMPPNDAHRDEPLADWLPLLDEELQRLPEKYRLPLVLCDLDGKTRKEAARQLGWHDGTLSTRLTRARVMLAERLTRRGVSLAGGAAALAILHGAASAQVPAALTAFTVKAAMGFAAGSTATAVSASVAALTQGVLKTMLLSKLKIVVAVGLVLALVGFGVGAGALHRVAAEDPQAPVVAEVMPPAAKPSHLFAKLPMRNMPALALVSLTPEGAVVVNQSHATYGTELIQDAKGKPVPSSYIASIDTITTYYSREDVKLYDAAGKLLASREMHLLLKDEVIALVYQDGKEPDPRHLKLFKEGTLFLVLPIPKLAAPPAQTPPLAPPPMPKPSERNTPTPKAKQGKYSVLETTNFRILHNQPPEVVEKAAKIAEQTRVAMSKKWFGDNSSAWNPRCDLYLHATAQDYSEATGVPAKSPGHSTIRSEGDRVLSRRIDIHCEDESWPVGVLPHETTHVVLAGRYGNSALPRWADEGMAMLAESRDRIESQLRDPAKCHDDHMLFNVSQLMQMNEYPAPRYIGSFYAQSVSLVEYLSSLKGPQTFTAFLRDGLKSGYEPALQKHYGIISYADLERRWRQYAFKQKSAAPE